MQTSEPKQGIHARCKHGHEERIYTPYKNREQAERMAQMLDQRETSCGRRCSKCGSRVTCTVFGYEEDTPHAME